MTQEERNLYKVKEKIFIQEHRNLKMELSLHTIIPVASLSTRKIVNPLSFRNIVVFFATFSISYVLIINRYIVLLYALCSSIRVPSIFIDVNDIRIDYLLLLKLNLGFMQTCKNHGWVLYLKDTSS